MKYTILVNQLILSNTTLDLIDCAILDYLLIFCNSQNSKIAKHRFVENDIVWTWVNFQNLLEDMPLLRIKSKSALSMRIDKLVEEGFIEKLQGEDFRLYVHLLPKAESIVLEQAQPVRADEQGKTGFVPKPFVQTNSPFVQTNIHNTTIDNTNISTKISTRRVYSITYLLSIPQEDITVFEQKYHLSGQRIKWEAQKAHDWLEANGKKKSNHKSYLQNWLARVSERENPQVASGSNTMSVKDWEAKYGKVK